MDKAKGQKKPQMPSPFSFAKEYRKKRAQLVRKESYEYCAFSISKTKAYRMTIRHAA